MKARCALMLLLTGLVCSGCSSRQDYVARIDGKAIRLEFDSQLHSRVFAMVDGKATPVGSLSPSETIVANGASVTEFQYVRQTSEETDASGIRQKSFYLTGRNGQILKEVEITLFDDFPTMAFYIVRYTNEGPSDLDVTQWTSNRYFIKAGPASSPRSGPTKAAPMKTGPTGSFPSRPVSARPTSWA